MPINFEVRATYAVDIVKVLIKKRSLACQFDLKRRTI